jgi:beta-glucosidase
MKASPFIYGVASSAFQSEGGLHLGDRGASIWDDCEPHILDHSLLDEGPNSLEHIDEDIALLVKLGVKAYRFSLSWPRILPEGKGKVSDFGLNLYKTFIKKLVGVGIEPWVTLFHWDYPTSLEEQGGWLNPDSPKWMEEYAKVVAKAFKGLVKHYIIINEPQCYVELGYHVGVKAPWKKLQPKEFLLIGHNLLKGAALGAKAIKEVDPHVLIGLAETYAPYFPSKKTLMATDQARKKNFEFDNSLFCLSWWCDASYLGSYPQNYLKGFGAGEDLNPQECYYPYDFFGLNIYNGKAVDEKGQIVKYQGQRTSMDWPIVPECLYYGVKWVVERYKVPVYITENGAAFNDKVEDGKVHDLDRQAFIKSYLEQLKLLKEDNYDVRGFFYWSFLDNLEWENGYSPRFGLVYIDYKNGSKRIIKDSFNLYKKIITSQEKPK